MTATCQLLHDPLSRSYRECIHRPVSDIPGVECGDFVCDFYVPALMTCWTAKFFLKNINAPMPLTSCAFAFNAVWWLSKVILYTSLMTDLNQKESFHSTMLLPPCGDGVFTADRMVLGYPGQIVLYGSAWMEQHLCILIHKVLLSRDNSKYIIVHIL